MTGRVSAIVAATALLAGISVVANARSVPRTPAEGRPWEANLTHYRDGQDGEPSVAVNPTDPHNVIVTYLETGGAIGAIVYQQRLPRLQDEIVQTIQSCRYLVTHDGGRTWRMKLIPTTDAIMPNCADTYVLFDKGGTAYIMAGNFNPAFPLWDEVRVISSVDGGETWGAPATALRNTLNPGSPPFDDISRGRIRQYIDRYWLAIDDATGVLYITAVQTWIEPGGAVGPIGPIVSSTDGGRTWSDPVVVAPVGSPHVGAAFGAVAVAYNDDGCSCVVMALSRDRARTFTHSRAPFSSDARPQVVADPTHPGRFAMLVQRGTRLLVYVTPNSGRSWSRGKEISQKTSSTRFKTWISYSRSGVLGAGWRNGYADGTYDFWAAVSMDGGFKWRPARRVSTARSAAQHPIWVGGDDTSDVQFGPDDTLYASWGDWRTGDLEIFWGGFRTR
jgi:hypothetical protein